MTRKPLARFGVSLLLLLMLSATTYLWGQYLGSPGHSGYHGPPLQTSLPTTGLYSHGLNTAVPVGGTGTAAAPTTGTFTGRMSRTPNFGAPGPSYRDITNQFIDSQYRPPMISGATMANVAVNRAIYAGVRF